jgi:1-acyl-sn-glycerol-3-phosphate acyltransferase
MNHAMESSIVTKLSSRLLMGYFMLTIGVVGFALGYLIAVPLLFLGNWNAQLRRLGDWRLCRGIRVLMLLQPWLRARIELPSFRLFPIQTQGCLLVSNHRSHLDAFLLLSRVPGIRLLAKRSLFSIPFLGGMMRITRQIPTDRGDLSSFVGAMNEIQKRLEAGERVHVFPEMTRCEPGFSGTREFLLGPFHAAIRAKALVLPIVIRDTDAAWPKGRFGLSWREPVEVRALAPMALDGFGSAEALRDEVRHRIELALETPR